MAKYILKSKYHNTQEDWLNVYNNIPYYISKEEIETKINETMENIKKIIKGKKVAYAWSGGKDSLVLQIIMEKLGIKKGVCGISEKIEYPSFLNYITKNIPIGVEIIDKEISFDYLNKHKELIYPQNMKDLAKWYSLIQHNIQNKYFKKNNLDILILGRRLQDGNYVGKNGIYTKKDGTTIYSPLANWKHEDILAVIYYYNIKLPSIYFMANGFNLGTHNMIARVGDKQKCMEEIYNYDKEALKKLTPIELIKEFLNDKK